MSFEIIVRPASAVPVLKRDEANKDTASENDEALISWGKGPLGVLPRQTITSSRPPNPPPDEPDPDTPTQQPTFVFDEVSRITHDVRISQDGNAENYVDVEIIDQITFQGPNGLYVYRFTNT